MDGSAVDDPAELALAEWGRGDRAMLELGRDRRKDLHVLHATGLKVAVAAAHDLLDGISEVGDDVVDDPCGLRCRQAGGRRQVTQQVVGGHPSSVRDRGRIGKFLPEIGQVC